MGKVLFQMGLGAHSIDLMGKPVKGLDGAVIGRVIGVTTTISDQGGASVNVEAQVDDDAAWKELSALMTPQLGFSIGSTARVVEFGFWSSLWLSMRMSVGQFLVRLGRKIRGKG